MFGGAALAFLISGYGLLLVAIFRMVIYLVAGGGRVSCAQVLRNSRLSPASDRLRDRLLPYFLTFLLKRFIAERLSSKVL